MDWKDGISACFGEAQVFGGDVIAQKKSVEVFSRLQEEGVPWQEAIVYFAQYLLSKGCGVEHIDEQISLIECNYRSWLD